MSRTLLRQQRHTPRILRSVFVAKASPSTKPFYTAPQSQSQPQYRSYSEKRRVFHVEGRSPEKQTNPNDYPTTDFAALDVLGATPPPATSVDVCMYDGFGLNSGVTISDGSGALLVNGEAFRWRPWEANGELTMVNAKGQFEIPEEALTLLDTLWPRPDLLILGVGKMNLPLSPETKSLIGSMGMRVDVLDTRNAAAQFNLLATERGVEDVAAALIPIGWKEGEGAV